MIQDHNMQFGVRIVRNGIFMEKKMGIGWPIALTQLEI